MRHKVILSRKPAWTKTGFAHAVGKTFSGPRSTYLIKLKWPLKVKNCVVPSILAVISVLNQ